jgi:hypothetical protein
MNKKQIILLSIGIFVLHVFANSGLNSAYGQRGYLYLEAKVNPNASTATTFEPALNITTFEINNTQICPSGQCKIYYYIDRYNSFSGPDIPKSTLIFSKFEFRVQDEIGHDNLGEKKKALVEEYNMDITCKVNDIVEDNGQEKYYCKDSIIKSAIFNTFTNIHWKFNVVGTFDAKNNTLGIYGEFTDRGEAY